jgi:hypothetical protein
MKAERVQAAKYFGFFYSLWLGEKRESIDVDPLHASRVLWGRLHSAFLVASDNPSEIDVTISNWESYIVVQQCRRPLRQNVCCTAKTPQKNAPFNRPIKGRLHTRFLRPFLRPRRRRRQTAFFVFFSREKSKESNVFCRIFT